MAHIIIDCSADVLEEHGEDHIAEQVHAVAEASRLFQTGDIKVRINPYERYLVGGTREPFIHVFASVLEGRTTEQKAALSRAVVERLGTMFDLVDHIAMNVSEFEKATYCNRTQIWP